MSKFIIANWKANKNLPQIQEWLDSFAKESPPLDQLSKNLKVAVAPPAPFLIKFKKESDELGLSTASQDISHFPAGSYTGEVTASNLEELGLKYAIVGHSERRQHFNETSQIVAQKVKQAVEINLTPIVCLDQPYLQEQADQIRQLDPSLLNQVIVAYEPLEAIGSGQSQDPGQVGAVTAQIKQVFSSETAGFEDVGTDCPVLYGGSVDQTNIKDYFAVCDGVLVGGASLDAAQFVELIKAVI